jgi:hypothetical protein
MQQPTSRCLTFSGSVTLVAGLLHIAIIFGGPTWYAFFGAPEPMVQMVRAGALYPPIFCLVVAALLLICASYAFSGAGIIFHLPFLRTGLILIASVFILRGVAFIPLAILLPRVLARLCNCNGIDTFLVVTSVICLATGIGYAFGARTLIT